MPIERMEQKLAAELGELKSSGRAKGAETVFSAVLAPEGPICGKRKNKRSKRSAPGPARCASSAAPGDPTGRLRKASRAFTAARRR